ncbi:MAG: hypothetical protein GY710_19425 [Desulfobacteraceae bacterium]|nr:hypothetical protein [Desulfobacteraceae bacterium]
MYEIGDDLLVFSGGKHSPLIGGKRQNHLLRRWIFIKNVDELCHKCGHCQAICDNLAIGLPQINPLALEKKSNHQKHHGDIVKDIIKNRRSIRKYKDRKISEDEIKSLIETVRYAPSASNAHQVSWMVYSDDEKIKKIAELTVEWMKDQLRQKSDLISGRYVHVFNKHIKDWEQGKDIVLRNAPHFILVHGPDSGIMRQIDGVIALDYFEFAAISAGFGTCWAGLFSHAMQEKYGSSD